MIDPMSIDLPSFLDRWYGPPAKPASPLSDTCSWLPEPLREWYELSSQWTVPLMTLKRMRAPEMITVMDDKALFMADAGDAIWAFDTRDPSKVYEGQLHEEWKESAEHLSEFLIHNALNEAAYNATARRACEAVEEARLEEILSPLTEVSFGGWKWPRPGHRIYHSEGLVADVGPAMQDHAPWGNRPGFAEVQIGSNNPALLSYVDEISGINWFRSGRSN
jgi:hypothetical protein